MKGLTTEEEMARYEEERDSLKRKKYVDIILYNVIRGIRRIER